MPWGSHASHRRLPITPGTIDVPPPRMIHCAGCDSRFVLLPSQDLPPGWQLVDGIAPVCTDCTRPKNTLRAAPDRSSRERSFGPSERSRFRGCRVGHEIALGQVAIQIRAGARPPEGRDEAVQFLLGPQDLDEMIVHMRAIRAELTASQLPGTFAREGGMA
jgi:hypothetical protein